MQNHRLVWVVESARIASVTYRLRCLIGVVYLQKLGWQSVILFNDEQVKAFQPKPNDILILVKLINPARLELARLFFKNNCPVIHDLPDPIYYQEFKGGKDTAGGRYLKDLIGLCDMVTTASIAIGDGLKEVLNYRGETHLVRDPGLTSEHDQELIDYQKKIGFEVGKRILPEYPQLSRARLAWNLFRGSLLPLNFRKTRRRRLVWYGKFGHVYEKFDDIEVGVRALLKYKEELAALNKIVPIELAIMSMVPLNTFKKFFHDWPIPVAYANWSLIGYQRMMHTADLTLVPIGQDHISRSISGSRIVQSLAYNVPVITDPLIGFDALNPYLGLNGAFESGKAFLTNPDFRASQLDEAARILHKEFSPISVAARWDQLLRKVIEKKRGFSTPAGTNRIV